MQNKCTRGDNCPYLHGYQFRTEDDPEIPNDMLEKMKEIFNDPALKQEWRSYASEHGGSTYDPKSHKIEFLTQFFSACHLQYPTVAQKTWPQTKPAGGRWVSEVSGGGGAVWHPEGGIA